METLVSLSSLSEQSPVWFDVSQAFLEPRLVPPIAGVFLCGCGEFAECLASALQARIAATSRFIQVPGRHR